MYKDYFQTLKIFKQPLFITGVEKLKFGNFFQGNYEVAERMGFYLKP